MKDGSVAPKERVNITYKPATGSAKEEVELPLKLLVMGDFTQSQDDRPVDQREPVNVGKENFQEVLKAQNLGLKLTVPNRLADKEGGQLTLDLKFQSLKDFDPDSIVKNVPELAKLVELRDALLALKGPLGNVPEFRKKIQELVSDPGARERLLKELGLEG
ncbi:type VI secretion system contractile sheath small subunit [Desulfocurvibacter africanus]|uniref:Type VI secretion protein, VC_A0107 family n=1 Tax=Desulfocurvibacter africanus subsp. africanus str. Walvis Bay TaxID=690850 RepID=F3YWS3_DESAF|nr:type VI secretion system contractile sheath small subunit [Desulfocurvibacter africanus]EGJ50566.1 type VI secretion protein, VC_A0107 family [Desulfocurvibacter africanus subsp. africanus str. Walvis Bay]